jgi:signal transduction histidine kinase/ligand-binding sensor domain-containing protein
MLPRAAEITNRCRFALVFAVIASVLLPAAAAPNYFTRTWQVEQGLPQNKVTAVVQTADGYVWVGTYNGLARFDGVRFRVFDDNNTPELRSSRITSLFEAGDGTLWIGTENGDVSQYKDGHFASVPLHANWSGGKIYAITDDDAGDVWLLNEAGELARARDGKVLSPPFGAVSKVLCLARASDGTIWVEREGVVSALKNGRLSAALSTNDYVQGFCAARDGGFWVACNAGIRKWKDGKWAAGLVPAPWRWNVVANFMETSAGVLAGGTSDSGLWLVFPGRTNIPALHLALTNGLPSDWVISMGEDRENNLWCGTGAGLVLIRPNNLETISPPDNWKSRPVLSVLPAPDGALWVGTEGAGLYRLKNGDWTNFDPAQGIRNRYVWSLAADGAGKIWAGTWGGGLFEQKDDAFDFAPGLENFLLPAPALLFVGGELWIGTPAGALRYQNGKLESFNEIAGKPFGDVRAIAQDKSGALWFGTAGGGLVRRENGDFRRFKKSDGLSSDFIECLHFADDGALWIGTFGGGLDRFKNWKFSVINREQGLPNGVIGHIEADGRGFFWMSSFGGILRASEKDLNLCAGGEISEVPFLTYGINDGLPTLECSEGLQSAGGKTADGRLWFPTAKGLVAVDPAGVRINLLPPPVRMEAMRVDGEEVRSAEFGLRNSELAAPGEIPRSALRAPRLKIPPGRHRIEFEYTALSFVAPEKVRFKCRLNNFETEWADVGTKRVATYNYIPPGNYSFQVTACNNDGVWNETGASLKFEVLPYFWQTTWFHVLGGLATVLAAGGAVWFDTRRRMRRRLERAERQRDIERERSRIAQDIHDDLGAQLTRITMMSESARGELADPGLAPWGKDQPCQPPSGPDYPTGQAAKKLEKIYDTARELTRSMDEIVWAVSPRHDTLESLASYLEKFAQDWLAAAGIRCRLDLPLQFPEWRLTSEVRHNLFLACKEALHNVVKHSAATEVQIRLVVRQASFELEIEDNGRGFSPAAKRRNLPDGSGSPRGVMPLTRSSARPAIPHGASLSSGNGLENMARRLSGIGGTFELRSVPGTGTKIIFTVQLQASRA